MKLVILNVIVTLHSHLPYRKCRNFYPYRLQCRLQTLVLLKFTGAFFITCKSS